MVGQLIGNYRLLRPLGEGGMGSVWEAVHQHIGKRAAIKLLHPQLSRNPDVAERFFNEARAVNLIQHSGIVTIFEFGTLESGAAYIVMELLTGETLGDRLQRLGQLDLGGAMRLGRQVASALLAAHRAGIVHRDLKPHNVMIVAEPETSGGERAKLLDFGIAKLAEDCQVGPEGRHARTRTGVTMGTPVYMSPEQGRGARSVDAKADVYSLGVILYEALAGRPPFEAESAVDLILMHVRDRPPPLRELEPLVPEGLATLVHDMLAKPPRERPSMADVVARLEELGAPRANATLASVPAGVLPPGGAQRPVSPLPSTLARDKGETQPPGPRAAVGRAAGSGEPALSRAQDARIFCGRDEELGKLLAAVEQARAGQGRLLLLCGEPGIGKTRLADEGAALARAAGMAVLWGRCWEEGGAPAYWPWIQALRACLESGDRLPVLRGLGPRAGDLCELLPELRQLLPGVPAPPIIEPLQARFRLFDNLTAFLRGAAEQGPLAILLDDLHAADVPSLHCLHFVARALRGARILLLGTYRDAEVRLDAEAKPLLDRIAREGQVMPLRRLSPEEVASWLERQAGSPADAAAVGALHRVTEGNPLFVTEVLRLAGARGAGGAGRAPGGTLPDGVRTAIREQLARLPGEVRNLLGIAAVLGREFSVASLRDAAALSLDEVEEQLSAAIAAGVLLPGAASLHRFSHILVREALYGDLPPGRRAALHFQLGDALDRLTGPAHEEALATIAHHLLAGAEAGDVDKAIDAAERAAERATRLLAFEDAAALYERAIQLLEGRHTLASERGCSLLIALGGVHSLAGAFDRCHALCVRAGALARDLGAPELLARAALAYGTELMDGRTDPVLTGLLREALAGLDQLDSPLRVRVMARLASAMVPTLHIEEVDVAMRLARDAVDLARRLADAETLLYVLRFAISTLGFRVGAAERHALNAEIVELAARLGRRDVGLPARVGLIGRHFELGDTAAAESEIEAYTSLAAELPQPYYQWRIPMLRAMRAMVAGGFAEAERLSLEGLAIGDRGQIEAAPRSFWMHRLCLARTQGELQAVAAYERVVLAFSERTPHGYCFVAMLHALFGRLTEARRHLRRGPMPDDLLPMDAAAEACTLTGDAELAGALYEQLLLHDGINVTWIMSAMSCIGPVARHLGNLAALLGRPEAAARHYEDALALSRRTGARPYVARIQTEYAALLARSGEEERAQAIALLHEACATTDELGMPTLGRSARKQLDALGAAPARTDGRA